MTVQRRSCMQKLRPVHPRIAPTSAGTQVARTLGHNDRIGLDHLGRHEEGGRKTDGLVITTKALPTGDGGG